MSEAPSAESTGDAAGTRAELERPSAPGGGRGRERTRATGGRRGRYQRARAPRSTPEEIAIDATIRAASLHQVARGRSSAALVLERADLREKVRVRRPSTLVLFVVDASWSMVSAQRIRAAQGAVLALLNDAYLRRDRVGLVVFQRDAARLLLPPTASVSLARRLLTVLKVGGRTPLPAALALARRVFLREKRKAPALRCMMVVLTDAHANVPLEGRPAMSESVRIAAALAGDGVASLVIDADRGETDHRPARALAEALRGRCVLLSSLTADTLHSEVRETMWTLQKEAR